MDVAIGSLEPLGITELEERLYLAVLDGAGGRLGELSERLGVARVRVGRALGALESKGLITRTLSDPARFVPVAPDLSMRVLLLRRQEELERVRVVAEALTERFRRSAVSAPESLVEVVTGRDAMLQRVRQLWASAQEEVLNFDKPPYIMDPAQPNDAETQLLKRGVRICVIYDREALEIPGALADIERCVAAGERARVVAGLPMKLFVVDRHTGLVPLRLGEPRFESAILVHESPLLEAMAALFNLFWERASPLPFGSDRATRSAHRSEDLSAALAEVLVLLAAGHTEERIAQALGITRRTVGRRIERMMATLGVQTRFELAHKATLRGWLRGAD